MSAYGTVAAPTPIAPLEPLICSIPSGSLSTYPVTLSDGPDDLIHYLHEVFVHELEGEWSSNPISLSHSRGTDLFSPIVAQHATL